MLFVQKTKSEITDTMNWMGKTTLFVMGVVPTLTANLHTRVVGGTLGPEGSHPFLVSLWYMKDNPFTENTKMHHVCGGTLIDPDWVLTAAHCFEPQFNPGVQNLESWRIVIGKHNQLLDEETNQIRAIEGILKYDKWNTTTLLGDAALLKLNQSIDMSSEGASSIQLDFNTTCAVPGADCFVVGWGQVAESPYGYGMYVPVAANMPVVDTKQCQDAFKLVNIDRVKYFIDDSVLCAGHVDGGVDSCYGDSGGPLVCKCNKKEVVSGIVSTGHGCARKGLYGIYTRVSLLKDWIKERKDERPCSL